MGLDAGWLRGGPRGLVWGTGISRLCAGAGHVPRGRRGHRRGCRHRGRVGRQCRLGAARAAGALSPVVSGQPDLCEQPELHPCDQRDGKQQRRDPKLADPKLADPKLAGPKLAGPNLAGPKVPQLCCRHAGAGCGDDGLASCRTGSPGADPHAVCPDTAIGRSAADTAGHCHGRRRSGPGEAVEHRGTRAGGRAGPPGSRPGVADPGPAAAGVGAAPGTRFADRRPAPRHCATGRTASSGRAAPGPAAPGPAAAAGLAAPTGNPTAG